MVSSSSCGQVRDGLKKNSPSTRVSVRGSEWAALFQVLFSGIDTCRPTITWKHLRATQFPVCSVDPLSFLFCPSSTFSFKDTETKSESQGSQKAAEEPGGNASSEALETQVRDMTSPGLRDGDGPGYCDIESVRVTTESCHLLQKGPAHTQVVRLCKFAMGKPHGHALKCRPEWSFLL